MAAAWGVTAYELSRTIGALLWLDLFATALLVIAVYNATRWHRRRGHVPRGRVAWGAVLALLASAAVVWAGRPYLAERLLISRYDVQPMKQWSRSIPRPFALFLQSWKLAIHETANWSSGEGLSKRKIARDEDLRDAMRLLAICRPRVFTLSCSRLTDFRALEELRHLQHLYLYGTIEANAPLPHLPSVRELRATGCKLGDFDRVAAIASHVKVLRLIEYGYPAGINVSGIESLRLLEHLDIRHCSITGNGVEEALRRIPRVDRFSGWK